ncbi:hypothetical protein KW798_02475 [Candidatus Parcubacteria bacterium]|nr:hypothetical protein [Candidatus Parcubacteria bacterium]
MRTKDDQKNVRYLLVAIATIIVALAFGIPAGMMMAKYKPALIENIKHGG